jgi:uncharacterized protein YcbX
MPVTIEQLWIYPVKSLAGIQLSSTELGVAGLKGDREWMIVDDKGVFLTQRKLPRMATIKTALRGDQLILSCKGDGDIALTPPAGDSEPVQVWSSHCRGLAADAEINRWICQAIGVDKAKLVYFDKRQPRPVDPERFGPYHTHFADGSPYLVTNLASLQALNLHLLQSNIPPVNILRFRSNIVISGLPAFAEHNTQVLRKGSAVIALKDRCQRCSVITVDQRTGIPSPEQYPFQALAQINGMPDKPKAPVFGVNSVLTDGAGTTIRCGEQWEIG